MTNIRITAGSW